MKKITLTSDQVEFIQEFSAHEKRYHYEWLNQLYDDWMFYSSDASDTSCRQNMVHAMYFLRGIVELLYIIDFEMSNPRQVEEVVI